MPDQTRLVPLQGVNASLKGVDVTRKWTRQGRVQEYIHMFFPTGMQEAFNSALFPKNKANETKSSTCPSTRLSLRAASHMAAASRGTFAAAVEADLEHPGDQSDRGAPWHMTICRYACFWTGAPSFALARHEAPTAILSWRSHPQSR